MTIWRSTCFFIDEEHGGHGLAFVASKGAHRLLAKPLSAAAR